MEDVLDDWNAEQMKLQIEGGNENTDLVSKMKVCFFWLFSCFGIKEVVLRRGIALKIKEINEYLDVIVKQIEIYNLVAIKSNESNEKPKRKESISFIDLSEIYGRDDEKKTLVNKLLSESSEAQKGPRVISIVGMGGIGKTTLAQLAFKDDEITRHFHKKMWVCVSDPFNTSTIANAILGSFKKEKAPLEYLLGKVRKSIEGKKFFLVLDDVWTEDCTAWEQLYTCLKDGLPGSKILVTTRKEIVACTIKSYASDILYIKELSEGACWSIFKKLAFFDRTLEEREKLEGIGREIVGKCKGLPLAAKIMGSLLRNKKTREEWRLILDNEMWKLESFERDIFPPLLLSYNDLPPMVKSCFLYCAIFLKDSIIDRKELIHLWMAQGYLSSNQNENEEIIGEEYFNILATRSFFQEFEEDMDYDYNVYCKMHDVVHDVALFLSRNECLVIDRNLSTNFSLDKTRHLLVALFMDDMSRISISGFKKLRSLLIYNLSEEFELFPLIIEKLTHLRSLSVDSSFLHEIPREISKMTYLKFLYLRIRPITKLPDTLCELYNLQTLMIHGTLNRLPQRMEKLINLRYLILHNHCCLNYMPKGIERLTCLRRLSHFIVKGCDDNDNNNACSVEGLKNLNHLRGFLRIEGLRYVHDESEIKSAEIWNKKNLLGLGLKFRWMAMCPQTRVGHRDHEILLKSFNPLPPNLEDLEISSYKGSINIFVSPNWMSLLPTLKKLVLWACVKWECLPPLGKWPYLESVEIGWIESIKRVSNEFLGVESGGASSSSSSSSKIIIFPKLKYLTFENLENWEEWDYGITRKDEEDITIMPHLRSLKFVSCSKLRVLPEELFQRTTLEESFIDYEGSQILVERYEEWRKRKQSQRVSTSS